MSFDLFGPPSKCDIRVGYISTDRGLVSDVSVYEANKYAQLNPGTQFIVRDRKKIRYMNINGVNALNTTDGLFSEADTCKGVDFEQECGPAQAIFYGGAGIGAQGNPIIGEDGSVMAIDLVSGGFGYQYPPNVKVEDNCGIGAGAVTKAILGETGEIVEVYDQEDDFEVYDLSPCSGEEPLDYGKKYNINGDIVGDWNPRTYTDVDEDPIRREIEQYQEFLAKLTNPWWFTGKEAPLSVTSDIETKRSQYKVTHPAWGDFMNKYAISPVPPSDVPGSDFAGIPFALEWEEDFPYDGEYIFRGLCDNKSEFYFDNKKVANLKSFKDVPEKIKKNVTAGVHKIRLDLYNVPIMEIIDISPDEPEEKELLIDYRNLHPANKKINVSSDGTLIKLRDGDGNDTNSSLRIISSDVDARFSKDGKRLIYDTSKNGSIKVRFEWNDNPRTAGLAVERIRIGDRLLGSNRNLKSKKSGRDTDTITVTAQKKKTRPRSTQKTGTQTREVFNTIDYIEKADRDLWRINPTAKKKDSFLNRFGVLPFDPTAVKKVKKEVPGTIKKVKPRKAQAKLQERDGKLFLKVIGDGKVKINFELEVDDNLITSGVFAREVRIDTDDKPLNLKRDIREVRYRGGATGLRGKEKETIKGHGEFSGGKEYRIKTIGGSNTAGYKTVDETKILFDDDANNGFDENGNLRITSVTVIDEPEQKVVTDKAFTREYPTYPNASTDDYAGVHVIRWERINFPVDGNYTVEIAVDDNAKVFIGNRDGGGKKEIGNGLRDIKNEGDEVILEKKGYQGNTSIGTGPTTYTRFFKAGSYRIRVELEQIEGKPLAKGNPMAFAMDIKAPLVLQEEVISAKSWNDNPMGVAFTIKAPEPPIPQEPIPFAEGRCPRNPIWTTRFPGSSEKWYPVIHPAWSKFTNRYAMSPIPPLGQKGSEGGGIIYTTTWDIDLETSGFYGMKGTVDNGGQILVDDRVVLRGGYFTGANFAGKTRTLEGFRTENPGTNKFFLTAGTHKITVQVENKATTTYKTIEQKIFNTADWAVRQPVVESDSVEHEIVYIGLHPKNKKLNVSQDRKLIKLRDGDGNDTNSKLEILSGDVTFSADGKKLIGKGTVKIRLSWKDNPNTAGLAVRQVRISGGKLLGSNRNFNKSRGQDTDTFTLSPKSERQSALVGGTSKDGVTYNGPEITTYRRDDDFGKLISPAFPNGTQETVEHNDKKWIMTWTGVEFPETGRYTLKAIADDVLSVKIDGQPIGGATVARVFEGLRSVDFTASKGKRTVQLELTNIDIAGSSFENNPVVAGVIITRKAQVADNIGQPWTTNPVGISAMLIPPPCPRVIKGKGVVSEIEVDDPGNGYPAPPGDGYPVLLELDRVDVVDTGINYRCGEDQLVINPSNGVELSYECDTFGRIKQVTIDNPGTPFKRYPTITMPSDTGVRFRAVPRFKVVRDPIVEDPEKLLQVTDLVGLKQTGYIDGRPYYGATFIEEGKLFAGYYDTPGRRVQVYATLQESITGEVTTRPSAILRQGTDISSNDPRLNIPGTPQDLN